MIDQVNKFFKVTNFFYNPWAEIRKARKRLIKKQYPTAMWEQSKETDKYYLDKAQAKRNRKAEKRLRAMPIYIYRKLIG